MIDTVWQRIHGGSTHFPIVLLLASVVFDFAARRTRDEGLRRGLQVAGFGSAVAGLLGAVGAVVAGLMLTRGRMLGAGYERIHHLFVWPALSISAALVGWRALGRGRIPVPQSGVYLAGMSVVSVLMIGAGYSGGEMLMGTAGAQDTLPVEGRPLATASLAVGRQLFVRNCAHCHGANARGEEGPDLHNLDWTDDQLEKRIRNGKKGQMTAFGGKLSSDEIKEVIAYLRTLK